MQEPFKIPKDSQSGSGDNSCRLRLPRLLTRSGMGCDLGQEERLAIEEEQPKPQSRARHGELSKQDMQALEELGAAIILTRSGDSEGLPLLKPAILEIEKLLQGKTWDAVEGIEMRKMYREATELLPCAQADQCQPAHLAVCVCKEGYMCKQCRCAMGWGAGRSVDVVDEAELKRPQLTRTRSPTRRKLF